MEDNRPIKGSQSGQYNMRFVDWTGEIERILDEGEDALDYYEEIDRENNPEYYAELDRQAQEEAEALNIEIKKQPLKHEFKKLLIPMRMGSSSRSCPICVENFKKGDKVFKLPCDHLLHMACVKPWFAKSCSCPLCRLDLNKHFMKEMENDMEFQ